MKTFKLSNTDFRNLRKIYNINKNKRKINNKWNYSKFELEQCKSSLDALKSKFLNLAGYLSPQYTNYNLHLSNIRSRNGKYRTNFWLSLVPEYKLIDKRRYEVGQLQISVEQNGISIEILFSKYAWNERYRFVKILEKMSSKLKKYFVIFYDKLNNFNEEATPEYTEEFIRRIINERKNDFALYYFIPKAKAIKGVPLTLILKELNDLKKIYAQIYKNKNVITLPRSRKSTSKLNTEDYFMSRRKKGSFVERKHAKLQKKLFNRLKKLYKKPHYEVETEPNFVDIRVEGRNKIFIYEIKTDKDPVKCIRQSLGQLLFYSFREKLYKKKKEIQLIAVGPTAENNTNSTNKFSQQLVKDLNMKFKYYGVPELIK